MRNRTGVLAWVALVLSGCCGNGQCDRPEGSSCSTAFECDGTCVERVCRTPCKQGCRADQACSDDPLLSRAGVCLVPPAADSQWRVHVDGLKGAVRGRIEVGDPDDFVCLEIAGKQLCTEERTGVEVDYQRNFRLTFTPLELETVQVSVYDSNATFVFDGCEDDCVSLGDEAFLKVGTGMVNLRPYEATTELNRSAIIDGGMTIELTSLP